MSRFMNPTYRSLKPYVPGEIPRGRTFVKLNTNESPYPPSPRVIECFNTESGAQQRLYSDPQSIDLNRAIAGSLKVRQENIMTTGGSDEALELAFIAYAQDGIAYADETYGFYRVLSDLHFLDAKVIPLKEDFSLDPKDYFGLGRMIVIANPNAPTGMYLKPAELEAVVQNNPDHIVVIDEAYVDFGNESMVPYINKYDNLIVVQTFSKSRSLAGARIGFACANAELIEDLEKLRNSRNPYDISRQSQLAGVRAVEDAVYYREQCMKIVATREWTMRRLRELGFEGPESYANFVFVKHPKFTGGTIQQKLRDRGFLVRHFTHERIKDYNRITIGTREDMEALCEALEEITGYGKNS